MCENKKREERLVLTDEKHVWDEAALLKKHGWTLKVQRLPSGSFLIRAKQRRVK